MIKWIKDMWFKIRRWYFNIPIKKEMMKIYMSGYYPLVIYTPFKYMKYFKNFKNIAPRDSTPVYAWETIYGVIRLMPCTTWPDKAKHKFIITVNP
jgi:hypothetical protein